MKQKIYLPSLFLTLLLCFGLTQAEVEYGACFHPEDNPEVLISWDTLDDQAAEEGKIINVKVTYIQQGKFKIYKAIHKEILSRSSNDGMLHTIKIRWNNGSAIKIHYKDDKSSITKGEVSYNHVINGQARCGISNTEDGLANVFKVYKKPVEKSQEDKSYCKQIKQIMPGVFTGVTIALLAAYLCGY